MPGYTGSHKTNILEAISLPSWRNVKRGQIISATYKNKDGASKPKLYLVLHTFYPATDGKMHVLDLDYINPKVMMNKLIKHTVQKQPLSETFRAKTYTRLEFKNDEKDFYNTTVKPLVNDGFGPSYRTIFPQNLTKIRIIDYEWAEGRTEDKQGITKEEHKKTKE